MMPLPSGWLQHGKDPSYSRGPQVSIGDLCEVQTTDAVGRIGGRWFPSAGALQLFAAGMIGSTSRLWGSGVSNMTRLPKCRAT
jgi:hypothetical protein